jgi:hypothetical protein
MKVNERRGRWIRLGRRELEVWKVKGKGRVWRERKTEDKREK